MSVTLAPTGAPANAPRENWANGNAAPIVRLLDPAALCCGGELAPAEVAPALRRVLLAWNVAGERASMRRALRESGRFVECGSTDDRARARLEGAAAVLRYAVAHGSGVHWG